MTNDKVERDIRREELKEKYPLARFIFDYPDKQLVPGLTIYPSDTRVIFYNDNQNKNAEVSEEEFRRIYFASPLVWKHQNEQLLRELLNESS